MKKLLTLTFFSFLLSGCGFTPLYAQREGEESGWSLGGSYDGSIAAEMEKVKVESIPERFGQQIRNELIDILSPMGVPEQPEYKLHVIVNDEYTEKQALRRDITATREKVMYSVIYYMTEKGEQLFRADSIAYASYDIMANPYSTTMAQKKAEADAAKIIANDIALRVGAYFHAKFTEGVDIGDPETRTNR